MCSLQLPASVQVLPDFELANWTHFLVFSASSFSEASIPASHLILGLFRGFLRDWEDDYSHMFFGVYERCLEDIVIIVCHSNVIVNR